MCVLNFLLFCTILLNVFPKKFAFAKLGLRTYTLSAKRTVRYNWLLPQNGATKVKKKLSVYLAVKWTTWEKRSSIEKCYQSRLFLLKIWFGSCILVQLHSEKLFVFTILSTNQKQVQRIWKSVSKTGGLEICLLIRLPNICPLQL